MNDIEKRAIEMRTKATVLLGCSAGAEREVYIGIIRVMEYVLTGEGKTP